MKVNLISFYNRFDEYSTKYSLGALKLAAYLGQIDGVEVEIVPLNSEQEVTDDEIARILHGNPQMVGIQNYMWTERHAQRISKIIKEKHPEILRLVGGPSTNTVDFDMWSGGEIFTIGEGEVALAAIAQARMQDPNFNSSKVKGLQNPDGSPVDNVFSREQDLSDRHVLYKTTEIPAGLPLFSDKVEAMKQDRTPETFAWYETTRGCAYNCGYCGHKTRNNLGYIDLDNIEEEIKGIKKAGIKRLFIVDPIVGGNKERGKEVLKLCNKEIPETEIIAYLRPELLDSEFVEILEQTNLEEMRFGIQTLNPNVPAWVRSNSINIIQRELSKLKGRDINWRAELIVGLPGDDMTGLRDTMKTVITDFQPTVLAAYHLTAIKGTKMYSLVDGTGPEGLYLRCDENSQAIASHSYTEEEFKRMACYANSMTGLYNYLKKAYPDRNVSFVGLEKFIIAHIQDADTIKLQSFDDAYNEEFWGSQIERMLENEKNKSDQTWPVFGE